ncbi:MAG: hypothetical protein LPK47_13530 [Bacteroidota bacterium]|nr:hypothetical protein [Bacteroidota bacterium]
MSFRKNNAPLAEADRCLDREIVPSSLFLRFFFGPLHPRSAGTGANTGLTWSSRKKAKKTEIKLLGIGKKFLTFAAASGEKLSRAAGRRKKSEKKFAKIRESFPTFAARSERGPPVERAGEKKRVKKACKDKERFLTFAARKRAIGSGGEAKRRLERRQAKKVVLR